MCILLFDKSGDHLSALCQFDYSLPLVVCSHILYVVVPIAAMLHIISYDLIEAVSECQTLIRYFETERNDISVYSTNDPLNLLANDLRTGNKV
jgi:hypothetical protein